MRASQWLREKPDIFPYKANACRTEDKTSKRRTCPPFAGRLITLSHDNPKFTWRTVDAFVVRGTELRHSSAVQWDCSRTRSILKDVRWESKAVRFRLFFMRERQFCEICVFWLLLPPLVEWVHGCSAGWGCRDSTQIIFENLITWTLLSHLPF